MMKKIRWKTLFIKVSMFILWVVLSLISIFIVFVMIQEDRLFYSHPQSQTKVRYVFDTQSCEWTFGKPNHLSIVLVFDNKDKKQYAKAYHPYKQIEDVKLEFLGHNDVSRTMPIAEVGKSVMFINTISFLEESLYLKIVAKDKLSNAEITSLVSLAHLNEAEYQFNRCVQTLEE